MKNNLKASTNYMFRFRGLNKDRNGQINQTI